MLQVMSGPFDVHRSARSILQHGNFIMAFSLLPTGSRQQTADSGCLPSYAGAEGFQSAPSLSGFPQVWMASIDRRFDQGRGATISIQYSIIVKDGISYRQSSCFVLAGTLSDTFNVVASLYPASCWVVPAAAIVLCLLSMVLETYPLNPLWISARTIRREASFIPTLTSEVAHTMR
ncbi:hypothetical protein GQ44DRAFT_471358 [Phaeosphaeriaceae sp. PMI808]|nr:hypothetical protein GQ44DRAFT_471358 [Phaeosphaeriaceae sp. PMI808]